MATAFDIFWGGAMKMRAIAALFAVCLLALGVVPVAAQNGAIDLFEADALATDPNDPSATNFLACQGAWDLFFGFIPEKYIHVYVRVQGALRDGGTDPNTQLPFPGGVTGAELYVDGVESLVNDFAFAATVVTAGAAATGNIILPSGDLGDERIGNIPLGNCLPDLVNFPDEEFVFLASINVRASQQSPSPPPEDVYLTVVAGDPPNNPNFPCQLVTICDSIFTKVCVNGGQFVINPVSGGCEVAVRQETWSGIKALYR
jgi:hypothetical protein